MKKLLRKGKRKKGMIEFMAMLLYRIIFITAFIYVFVLFANMIVSPFPDISESKAELLTGRVLYSKAIHHYDESIGREYNDIIDLDKLDSFSSQQELEIYFKDNLYHPSRSDLLVFNLTTVHFDTNINLVRNTYISNETQYKLLVPKARFEGKGAVTKIERDFKSKCLLNSEIIPCDIILKVLVPNS